MKKSISVWIISIILCIVSIEGLLSLPDILGSVFTLSQYLVAICHIAYVITGIIIVIGIWRSFRWAWVAVVIWGSTSLGAAIGGPLAFGPPTEHILRTIIIISVLIFLITAALTWYVRKITKNKT